MNAKNAKNKPRYKSEKKQLSALETVAKSNRLLDPVKCAVTGCFQLSIMKHGYCSKCWASTRYRRVNAININITPKLKLFLIVFLFSSILKAEEHRSYRLGNSDYVRGDNGYSGHSYKLGDTYYYSDNQGNRFTQNNLGQSVITDVRRAPQIDQYNEPQENKELPPELIEAINNHYKTGRSLWDETSR